MFLNGRRDELATHPGSAPNRDEMGKMYFLNIFFSFCFSVK